MLVELEIRDFAIIEHLRLRLDPGFNVLTGETGAGKSIIVGAMGQLLGERADTDTVRAGAERAIIEGVFEPGDAADPIREVLESYGIDEDPVLIMAREIQAAGRSTGRINGRNVPIRALSEVGQILVDIHGQSENASLKREPEHVLLLDRYAGIEPQREALGERVRALREAERELASLQEDEAERLRNVDLLRFQVDEIESAGLSADEEEALRGERTRLANAERLMLLAERAVVALRGEEEAPESGGLDGLDAALVAVEELAQIDDSLEETVEPLRAASEAATDAARRLRDYRERLEFDAQRLEEVEERLGVIMTLKRKYGPEIADVLEHARQASERLDRIDSADERTEELKAQLEGMRGRIGQAAADLTLARRAAGERLAEAVEAQMDELGMPGSRFEVAIEHREDPEGVPVDGRTLAFTETGVDRVAFRVSTNPGEPTRRLIQVASGGETARIMLALKSILTDADRIPTLIFDEIDAGIGGRIGAVVGRKLWQLSDRHQVMCVTHLPQVAAFGDTHFHVRKLVAEGRTQTAIQTLESGERIDELTQMLGGGSGAARDNARQLLDEAHALKEPA